MNFIANLFDFLGAFLFCTTALSLWAVFWYSLFIWCGADFDIRIWSSNARGIFGFLIFPAIAIYFAAILVCLSGAFLINQDRT